MRVLDELRQTATPAICDKTRHGLLKQRKIMDEKLPSKQRPDNTRAMKHKGDIREPGE